MVNNVVHHPSCVRRRTGAVCAGATPAAPRPAGYGVGGGGKDAAQSVAGAGLLGMRSIRPRSQPGLS
jgi:hypothetical protein